MSTIITAPNPILSQSAKQISKVNAGILKLIEEMKAALLSAKDPEGVGLAAPQIGKSISLFMAKPTPTSSIHVFINPDIEARGGVIELNQKAGGASAGTDEGVRLPDRRKPPSSARNASEDIGWGKQAAGPAQNDKKENDSKHIKLEGCLSLPSIWGEVKRHPQIIVSYLDEKGKPHKRLFKGFMATVIQHEIDHLNGILFPKRVLEQKGKLYKSVKDKKGGDIFEEIDL